MNAIDRPIETVREAPGSPFEAELRALHADRLEAVRRAAGARAALRESEDRARQAAREAEIAHRVDLQRLQRERDAALQRAERAEARAWEAEQCAAGEAPNWPRLQQRITVLLLNLEADARLVERITQFIHDARRPPARLADHREARP